MVHIIMILSQYKSLQENNARKLSNELTIYLQQKAKRKYAELNNELQVKLERQKNTVI